MKEGGPWTQRQPGDTVAFFGMERAGTCPECSQAIAANDTIVLARGRVVHFDCRRPHTLGPEERLLLFRYCWDHAVAECPPCVGAYRLTALAMDLFAHTEHLCPRCRADLTATVRAHLHTCTMLPTNVRQRAREAREAAHRLVKQSRELVDSADVLKLSLEVAVQTLRRTIRDAPQRGS